MSKPTVTAAHDKNFKKETPSSKGSESNIKAGQKMPQGKTANTKLGGSNTTTKTGR